MNDIVKRLRNYALAEDLFPKEREDLLKAASEIEQLRKDLQNRNGQINRLKHELQSVEYALGDARINLTIGAADVAHEMRCELDTLRAELDEIKEVEFPRRVEKVAEGWRGKCEKLQVELDALKFAAVPDAKQLSDCKSAAYVLGWNECRAAMLNTPKPGERTTDTEFKQFLSDVMTAAGLVAHGKQSKALAERLSARVMELYAAPPSVPDGFVLVPAEPAPEMGHTYARVLRETRSHFEAMKAAIQAAPKPGDSGMLRRGLIHLTEENAVAMGKAIAAFTEHRE